MKTVSLTWWLRMKSKTSAPVGGVPVPLVDVVRRAVRRQQAGHVVDRVDQLVRQVAEVHRRDHHRVADQLPLHVAVSAQRALEPVQLLLAGDGAGGVADLAVRVRRRRGGGVHLLAAVGAQVEHAELGQGAEPEPAEQPAAVPDPDAAVEPRGHPLVVRPVRAGAAGLEAALAAVAVAGGVVLGAVLPRVVGDLVVVPGDDPRVLRVGVLQVRVGLVLRVPLPVVRQRDHLVGGLVLADVLVVRAVAVLAGAVLVEVVAQVHHRVQVVARGQTAVGAEPAGLEVGAGDHAEAQVVRGGVGGGGGAGAPGPAGVAVPAEPVVVPAWPGPARSRPP